MSLEHRRYHALVPLDDWRMHITPTQLIRSRGFKPREISLAEIAGVGLLCKLGSRSSGWYTVVWLATGEPMGVSLTAVSNIKTPKGHWVWYGVNYVPPLDWQAVAAGRAAHYREEDLRRRHQGTGGQRPSCDDTSGTTCRNVRF